MGRPRLTALYPPLALWAVGGLETVPAVLAVTAEALLLARDDGQPHEARRRCSCRRSGARRTPVAPARRGSRSPWRWRSPRTCRRWCGTGGRRPRVGIRSRASASRPAYRSLLRALLEAARLAVYGHLLPNWAVYKVGSGVAYDVLSRFVDQAWPVVLIAGLGLTAARGRARLLAVPLAIYAAGSLAALDSVNGFSRFFLPAWPQLALLAGLGVVAVGRRLGSLGVPAIATATTLLLIAAVLSLGDPRTLELEEIVPYAACEQETRARAAAGCGYIRQPWPASPSPTRGSFRRNPGPARRSTSSSLSEPVIQRTVRCRPGDARRSCSPADRTGTARLANAGRRGDSRRLAVLSKRSEPLQVRRD